MSEPRESNRGWWKSQQWFVTAAIDAFVFYSLMMIALVIVSAAASWCFGQAQPGCYIDPYTGRQVCPLAPGGSPVAPRASQLAPQPDPRPSLAPNPSLPVPSFSARVAGIDREQPAPPGATPWSCGSGTFIYDDGARAIHLTCAHNLRNTSPPYWVRFAGGNWLSARILAIDEENDLAALETAGNLGVAPAIPAEGPPPARVTGCGFGGRDEGYRYAAVTGPLSTIQFSHPGFRSFAGQVREGDSGGPVLGPDGRLVGVLWGNHIEYGQVMFTCDEPLRRFLDRILPNRPGRVIPHATQPRPDLPAPVAHGPSQVPVPANVVPAPPYRESGEARGASGESQQPNLVPIQPPAAAVPPTPHSPLPSIPPLEPTTSPTTSSGGGVAPPWSDHPAWPSVYDRSSWFDRLGRSGITTALTYLGLSATGAGLVAIPAWLLVKWGARREAARIRARLHPTQHSEATSATAAPAASAAEQTFRFTEHTSTNQPVTRDASEGVQLLQLGQLEGRDPLLDAVAGRTIRARLETIAEGHGDPAQRQWARDLMYELDREFNKIAPAKTSISN